jgi:hypothetical protein
VGNSAFNEIREVPYSTELPSLTHTHQSCRDCLGSIHKIERESTVLLHAMLSIKFRDWSNSWDYVDIGQYQKKCSKGFFLQTQSRKGFIQTIKLYFPTEFLTVIMKQHITRIGLNFGHRFLPVFRTASIKFREHMGEEVERDFAK